MAISNNVYPEHLGIRFCFIYKDMYEQRKSYDKKSAEVVLRIKQRLGRNFDVIYEFNHIHIEYDPK